MHRDRGYLCSIAVLSLFLGGTASADPITLSGNDIGKSFTVTYRGDDTTSPVGTATFTLKGVSDRPSDEGGFSAYNFDYSITNAMAPSSGSAISSIAFNVSPELILAGSTTTKLFSNTRLSADYPDAASRVGVCFGASPECADTATGLAGGNFETGSFLLGFARSTAAMTIDDFFLRYQSLSDTGEVVSGTGRGTVDGISSGGTPVPEPDVLALFGAALLSVGFIRRRSLRLAKRQS